MNLFSANLIILEKLVVSAPDKLEFGVFQLLYLSTGIRKIRLKTCIKK